MLRAAFTTCFFTWGKVSLGTNGPSDPTRDLMLQDIKIDSVQHPRLVRLHLKHSKTDQFADIFIARTYSDSFQGSFVSIGLQLTVSALEPQQQQYRKKWQIRW